jgi:hypothetical protein
MMQAFGLCIPLPIPHSLLMHLAFAFRYHEYRFRKKCFLRAVSATKS